MELESGAAHGLRMPAEACDRAGQLPGAGHTGSKGFTRPKVGGHHRELQRGRPSGRCTNTHLDHIVNRWQRKRCISPRLAPLVRRLENNHRLQSELASMAVGEPGWECEAVNSAR